MSYHENTGKLPSLQTMWSFCLRFNSFPKYYEIVLQNMIKMSTFFPRKCKFRTYLIAQQYVAKAKKIRAEIETATNVVRTHFDSQLNSVIVGAVVLGLNKVDYSANEHIFIFWQIYLRFIIDNSRWIRPTWWCESQTHSTHQPFLVQSDVCMHKNHKQFAFLPVICILIYFW